MSLLRPYIYEDVALEGVRLPGRFRSTSAVNAAMGGYLSAATRYEAREAALLDLIDYLGAHMVVKDRMGQQVWEGMPTEVEIHLANYTLTYSLEEMYNAVAVIFDNSSDYEWDLGLDGITAWGTNATSIADYGRKEKVLTMHGLTEAEAEDRRDAFLGLHDRPLLSQRFTEEDVRQPYAMLRGRGYYWTCEWQVYTQASWGARDTDDQIGDIVSAECPFIASTTIASTTASCQRFRNARMTAWAEIQRLAAMGDGSGNPLTVGVWDDQELVVATLPTAPDYLKRGRRFTTAEGEAVDSWLLRAGTMLRQPAVPGAATFGTELDDPRNAILWQVAFNEEQGYPTLTPLQARDVAGLLLGQLDAFGA